MLLFVLLFALSVALVFLRPASFVEPREVGAVFRLPGEPPTWSPLVVSVARVTRWTYGEDGWPRGACPPVEVTYATRTVDGPLDRESRYRLGELLSTVSGGSIELRAEWSLAV